MKLGIRGVLLAGMLTVCSGALQAGTILSDSGINWSWTSSDIGEASGSLKLSADVAGSTLGNVRLAGFQLKGDSGFVVSSATASGWTWFAKELGAKGCGKGDDLGDKDSNLCFEAANIDNSVSDAANFDITVNFALSSGVLPDLLHLKVLWNEYDPCASFHFEGSPPNKVKVCDAGWNKVGDLISADFSATPPPGNDVPAPGPLALLGIGLAGLGFARRRMSARDVGCSTLA